MHELLATMAADNQAQAAAIAQISSAIGTMDQATQQNAAMVEQTSAAARNLTAEVGNLANQAGRFNVGLVDGNRFSGSVKPDYINAATYTSMIKPLTADVVVAP